MRKTTVRRRTSLAIALLLAVVISGGTYAAAFTTSTASFGIASAGGDMATVAVAAGQPDWGGILPQPTSEVLRPNGAGDETAIATQFPASGAHWEKVDEVSSDDDATYVGTNNSAWEEDLYAVANHAQGAGAINYVRVYAVVRASSTPSQTSAYIHIKTNGVEYNGPEQTVTTVYNTYSNQWNTNPQTGAAWTWTEIDDLQAGVGMRRAANGNSTLATQVYVEVNYRYVPLTGTVPTGNLYTITPRAGYPGDLAVKVYLLNTSNLAKAYHALNINLYLPGSAEAGQTPNYQVLTLDGGMATFNLQGSYGASTLRVTGGTYHLLSGQPGEWPPGWTVTPELVTEVTQR